MGSHHQQHRWIKPCLAGCITCIIGSLLYHNMFQRDMKSICFLHINHCNNPFTHRHVVRRLPYTLYIQSPLDEQWTRYDILGTSYIPVWFNIQNVDLSYVGMSSKLCNCSNSRCTLQWIFQQPVVIEPSFNFLKYLGWSQWISVASEYTCIDKFAYKLCLLLSPPDITLYRAGIYKVEISTKVCTWCSNRCTLRWISQQPMRIEQCFNVLNTFP